VLIREIRVSFEKFVWLVPESMTEWIHDLTLYSPLKMTHSKISISEEGVLLNPVLHDAKLLGVLTFESKRTLVIAQLGSGEINGMWLIGVERLNATNFYAGNIILDCTVESGPRANCDQAFKDLGLAIWNSYVFA